MFVYTIRLHLPSEFLLLSHSQCLSSSSTLQALSHPPIHNLGPFSIPTPPLVFSSSGTNNYTFKQMLPSWNTSIPLHILPGCLLTGRS